MLGVTSAVLLTAAGFKMHQVLTRPSLGDSLYQMREFTIVQAILITGLAIWLLSGLFTKAGWAAAVVTFLIFCGYTINQWVSGSDTCGCFGVAKVDPRVSLFLIDVPVLIGLMIFRPKTGRFLGPPWPKPAYFTGVCIFTFLVLGSMAAASIMIVPPQQTDEYATIDHQGWIGTRLEMLDQIDIAPILEEGISILFLYHHDCPTCRELAPVYSKIYDMLGGAEQEIKIAFIEMPPYGDRTETPIPQDTNCLMGTMDQSKKWYAASPILIVIEDGIIKKSWEAVIPSSLDELLEAVYGG
jgi:thiol-disulfide isomerase/thioredoxin